MSNINRPSHNLKIKKMQENEKNKKSNIVPSSQD